MTNNYHFSKKNYQKVNFLGLGKQPQRTIWSEVQPNMTNAKQPLGHLQHKLYTYKNDSFGVILTKTNCFSYQIEDNMS